jgi:hypothetical protein
LRSLAACLIWTSIESNRVNIEYIPAAHTKTVLHLLLEKCVSTDVVKPSCILGTSNAHKSEPHAGPGVVLVQDCYLSADLYISKEDTVN